MMLTGCLKLRETDQSEHETSVCHVFKRKKKSSLQWWKCIFFSLLLIHVTVHFMLLRKKCENKKETKVCNFKLESEVHQTNKQKKKQPTGFSWVGMSLYQLQGCPHPDLSQKGWEENLLKKCYSRGNKLHEPRVHYGRGGRTDPRLALRLSANVSRPWFLSAEVIHVM